MWLTSQAPIVYNTIHKLDLIIKIHSYGINSSKEYSSYKLNFIIRKAKTSRAASLPQNHVNQKKKRKKKKLKQNFARTETVFQKQNLKRSFKAFERIKRNKNIGGVVEGWLPESYLKIIKILLSYI